METLRKNPHIYEINLMTWLHDLSRTQGYEVNLKAVPPGEWRRLKDLGMDLIWLMGIWKRSPDSIKKARGVHGLVQKCRTIFDDFEIKDIAGSPYAVHDYVPDPIFGSHEELKALKKQMEEEGLFLILDFVPNHTACDHPWIKIHPEYYIMDQPKESNGCGEGFFLADSLQGNVCIAHGKDPYFPPWTDTAQINYARLEAHKAMTELLNGLLTCCHGLRCDMAMLPLKEVFRETWGRYLREEWNAGEFWALAIEGLRSKGIPFLLLAEAYWGKENDLLNLGFRGAYDKQLYDLMVQGNIQGVKNHLLAPVANQEKMVRFLENHDEPRAMQTFGPDRIKCAMVIHSTLPGMRFWQRGQFEGNRIRVPVQVRRAPTETIHDDLKDFAVKLLNEVNHPVLHEGGWEICSTQGWPDNPSHQSFLAWCWRKGEHRRLVVSNFSTSPAQGYVRLPPNWLPAGEQLLLTDPLKSDSFLRSTKETDESGLYVGLNKHDFHFFRVEEG